MIAALCLYPILTFILGAMYGEFTAKKNNKKPDAPTSDSKEIPHY